MEKYNDALKTLQQANAASPDNPEIQYQIGSIYYKENDPRIRGLLRQAFRPRGRQKRRPCEIPESLHDTGKASL